MKPRTGFGWNRTVCSTNQKKRKIKLFADSLLYTDLLFVGSRSYQSTEMNHAYRLQHAVSWCVLSLFTSLEEFLSDAHGESPAVKIMRQNKTHHGICGGFAHLNTTSLNFPSRQPSVVQLIRLLVWTFFVATLPPPLTQTISNPVSGVGERQTGLNCLSQSKPISEDWIERRK